MKFLIFGKGGQVGSGLIELLSNKHDVIGLDQEDLDLSETNKIASFITQHRPDWVINASAYTAVDKAESEATLADLVNHLAPKEMALACNALQCGFIHYSTDYVFDGDTSQPYLESDTPNPQSIYGETKLAGELAVMKAHANTIILRTSWVYAKQGANFMNTMLRLANERDEIGVVADQFGSPTLAYDLAEITVSIVEKYSFNELDAVAGVYHATGGGETNWHDFAAQILTLAGKQTKLKAITTADYPTAAPRPKYSVLNNQKLAQVFDLKMPSWKESLAKVLA